MLELFAELEGVEVFAVVAVVAAVVPVVGVVTAVVVAVVACVATVVLVEVGVIPAAVGAAVEVAASTDADGDAALTDMYPTITIRAEVPAAPASRRARLAG